MYGHGLINSRLAEQFSQLLRQHFGVQMNVVLESEGALAKIHADNPRLNIVRHLANAATDDAEDVLGGVSVLVKSNIAVKNRPFTAGLGALRKRIAASNAYVVARLRKASCQQFWPHPFR